MVGRRTETTTTTTDDGRNTVPIVRPLVWSAKNSVINLQYRRLLAHLPDLLFHCCGDSAMTNNNFFCNTDTANFDLNFNVDMTAGNVQRK